MGMCLSHSTHPRKNPPPVRPPPFSVPPRVDDNSLVHLWNTREQAWGRTLPPSSSLGTSKLHPWHASRIPIRVWMYESTRVLRVELEAFFLASRILDRLEWWHATLCEWPELQLFMDHRIYVQRVLGIVCLHIATKFVRHDDAAPRIATWMRTQHHVLPFEFTGGMFEAIERRILPQIEYCLTMPTLHDYITLLITLCDVGPEPQQWMWWTAIVVACTYPPPPARYSVQDQISAVLQFNQWTHECTTTVRPKSYVLYTVQESNSQTHDLTQFKTLYEYLDTLPLAQRLQWCHTLFSTLNPSSFSWRSELSSVMMSPVGSQLLSLWATDPDAHDQLKTFVRQWTRTHFEMPIQ